MADIVFESHVGEVMEEFETKVEKSLETIGLMGEGYAKRLAPVDTGRLRNSIAHASDMGEKAAYIGTNVEYAPYVELGTSRAKAQPYLRPAVTDHADQYKSVVESIMKS